MTKSTNSQPTEKGIEHTASLLNQHIHLDIKSMTQHEYGVYIVERTYLTRS